MAKNINSVGKNSLKYLAFILFIILNSCLESSKESESSLKSIDFDSLEVHIDNWHKARIDNLTKPYSWLSLTGFHWFENAQKDINNYLRFEEFPLSFRISGDSVFRNTIYSKMLSVRAPEKLIYLKNSTKNDSLLDNHPSALNLLNTHNDRNIISRKYFVIERDGKYALRVKDSLAPTRLNFKGIERFPFNKDMVFSAKLISLDSNKNLTLPNKMGYSEKMDFNYRIIFEHNNKEYSLYPIIEGDQMFLIFADKTNGESTYAACRYLYIDKPSNPDIPFILNFNEAFNPPCRFTEFATCPLPSPENYLDFPVTAGEKK